MEQLLAHIFGDYILQSDWMAANKSKQSFPCLVHVLIYTAVFAALGASWQALIVIGSTHFLLDRFPILIKKFIWFKNHINPTLSYAPFRLCDMTGYLDNLRNEIERKSYVHNIYFPPRGARMTTDAAAGVVFARDIVEPRLNYITAWLYIIIDNFFHLTINYLALKYLV